MSEREHIKSLVKGADLYRKQGLYEEAKEKYLEALSYLALHDDLSNRALIKELVEERIQMVDGDIADVEGADEIPELNGSVQDLIRDLFSHSERRETAAFEGALALMKFGQHKRALEEFETLLAAGINPLASAKNIITCSLVLGEYEAAIERFRKWNGRSLLTNQELFYIRDFLESSLIEKGIQVELQDPETAPATTGRQAKQVEEGDPEISSITIEFEEGQLRGTTEELKVSFQFGNVLSVVVPCSRKELINILQPSAKPLQMGFYSPIAFFRGTGKITSKTLIKHGPRQGDYLYDISFDQPG
ncbi:MAG: hypothetical protein C4576_19460 [Desulfobacteraceae bacterium]|nr:MAG: hypothetical protein C4576_19460 [Desulfobacteraceae bacterium]